MVGRGLRLHAGKHDCLVIDLADRCHNIARVATLDDVLPVADREGGPGSGGSDCTSELEV